MLPVLSFLFLVSCSPAACCLIWSVLVPELVTRSFPLTLTVDGPDLPLSSPRSGLSFVRFKWTLASGAAIRYVTYFRTTVLFLSMMTSFVFATLEANDDNRNHIVSEPILLTSKTSPR